jgi:hypothetical protein
LFRIRSKPTGHKNLSKYLNSFFSFTAQGCRPNAEELLVMSSVVATLVTFAASSLDKVELFVVVYAELFLFFTYIIISKPIKKYQSENCETGQFLI